MKDSQQFEGIPDPGTTTRCSEKEKERSRYIVGVCIYARDSDECSWMGQSRFSRQQGGVLNAEHYTEVCCLGSLALAQV